MIYYAKISKESDQTYLVEFPELKGCLTKGDTLKEALANAKEALDGWLASNCDRSLTIPDPKIRRSSGFYPIEVDISVSFPIILRKIRNEKKLSQREVANKLGVSQQAYARLETPFKSNPALLTVQKIAHALGRDLVFELSA